MEFSQPIKSINWISGIVNDINSRNFVITKEIQTILAKKTIIGDLTINDGFCDALTINGIQMQVLNQTVLKTSGDQTVTGNIKFNKISIEKYTFFT